MKWLKKALDLLLFSNIYLGICVIGVYMAFSLRPITDISRLDFILFVFFSTVSVYSLLRLRALEDELRVRSLYLSWAAAHKRTAHWIMRLSMISTGVTFLLLERGEQLIVVSLGFVWVLYNLPFFSRDRIRFGLRYIWFLKPLVVGFIIAGIATAVPYMDNSPYDSQDFLVMLLVLFLFVSSLVVVFEIKDHAVDAAFGTQTIATKWGVAGTKLTAVVMLLTAMFLFVAGHSALSPMLWCLYLLPLALLILFILLFIDEQAHEYIYWLVIDGWMIFLGIDWYLLNHHILGF